MHQHVQMYVYVYVFVIVYVYVCMFVVKEDRYMYLYVTDIHSLSSHINSTVHSIVTVVTSYILLGLLDNG